MPTFSSPSDYLLLVIEKQNNHKTPHFVFCFCFDLGAFSDSVCSILVTDQVFYPQTARLSQRWSCALLECSTCQPICANRYAYLKRIHATNFGPPFRAIGIQNSATPLPFHLALSTPFRLVSIASSPLDAFTRTSARSPQIWQLQRLILTSLTILTLSMTVLVTD